MKNSRQTTAYLIREHSRAILAEADRLQRAAEVLPLNVQRGSQEGQDANLRNIRQALTNIEGRRGAIQTLLNDFTAAGGSDA